MKGQGPMTAAPLSLVEPDLRLSPIRLSPESVSSREYSQVDQSQMVSMRLQTDALPRPPTPLAAPLQVFLQSRSDQLIELAKGFPRIAQAKVVRPTLTAPLHPLHQFG